MEDVVFLFVFLTLFWANLRSPQNWQWSLNESKKTKSQTHQGNILFVELLRWSVKSRDAKISQLVDCLKKVVFLNATNLISDWRVWSRLIVNWKKTLVLENLWWPFKLFVYSILKQTYLINQLINTVVIELTDCENNL